jgi:serine/threonine protein kinase
MQTAKNKASEADVLLTLDTPPAMDKRAVPQAAAPVSPGSGMPTALRETYEMVRFLGQGGMGRVFLARHRNLDRPVAIKTVLGLDAPARSRFTREGRVLAQLSHPNVVGVFDAGEADGVPYLVCEYVDGKTLRDAVPAGGHAPLETALTWMEHILTGLAHAHGRGVVHRDLKPDNVLISADGVAKVADFGLAGYVEVQSTPGLTRSGLIMGTPTYMSPEQARGEKVGPAGDVYSAGVILFELLTGRAPYSGPSFPVILAGHISGAIPDVRELRPEIPPAINALVRKAMSKDPVDRWGSATEFLEAIRGARGLMGMDTTPMAHQRVPPTAELSTAVPASKSRRWLAGAVALALVGLLLTVGGRVKTDTGGWGRVSNMEHVNNIPPVRDTWPAVRRDWPAIRRDWPRIRRDWPPVRPIPHASNIPPVR